MSNGQNDKVLDLKKRRLQKLKEEQAIKGINSPPEVLIEIEEIEAEIIQLQGYSRQDEPLPSVSSSALTPPVGQTTSPPESQPISEKKGVGKWWIPIVVALIGLAGVVFVAVWNNPTPVEPSEEEMQPAEFAYEVHVVSHTGENLPDAHVIIQVGGKAPLDGFADSNGFARIFIDGSYVREPARLMVEREGFHPYTQEIELYPDGLPDRIPLEPIEP